MAYVVTQSCCADASCVVACPVNCIHPAPGEPGFAEAEMLYVDADACVGCGACATACPVDAIKPDSVLTPDEQPFVAINADYYDCFPHPDRTAARGRGQAAPAARGAGRSAWRSSVPGRPASTPPTSCSSTPRSASTSTTGCPRRTAWCARASPPTTSTPSASRSSSAPIEEQPGFRYFLGVEVGRDLTLAELEAQYDAVVYSVGASADRSLGIAGRAAARLAVGDRPRRLVQRPPRQAVDLDVPLDGASGRAVVVGNGNVALDVARILALDPAALEHTDIAALPWAALCRSEVREVVVLGRRGPAEAAFTLPELVGLAGLAESGALDVVVDTGGSRPARRHPQARRARRARRAPARARRAAHRAALPHPTDPRPRRRTTTGCHRRRGRARRRDRGRSRPAWCCARSATTAGPSPTCPTTRPPAPCPTTRGRVRPGLYVAGWVKRGPTGFIGTNKSCAEETVASLLDDLDAGLPRPRRHASTRSPSVVAGRRPDHVDLAGWRAIDAEERRRGERRSRPRAKIVDVDEMVRVAHAPSYRPRRDAATLRSSDSSRARRAP